MTNPINMPIPMTSSLSENGASYKTGPVCPHCNSSLVRIRGRPIDRLFSLFVPIQRYRCSAGKAGSNCTWEGNLRRQSGGDGKIFHPLSDGARATKAWVHGQIRRLLHPIARSRKARVAYRVNGRPIGSFGDLSFEDMAQITLDAIGDAVLVVNPQGEVIYLNKVAETLTGWSSEEAIGHPVEEVFCIIDGTTRQPAMSPSQRAINEGQIVELALGSVLIRRDGTDVAIEDSAAPIPNRSGKVAGAVIVFHDARQSGFVMKEMSHLAQHDFLTGLPNRVLLVERLTQAIGMANRHHKQIALLFLDLDYFKQVNDTYGHVVGDHLLQDVAVDIEACVRATDTVSRHGGDEFVILLTEIDEEQGAAQVAEKLLAKFEAPRFIDGHEIQVTLSIGISIYPEDGIDADTLMRHADTAMYKAKDTTRNNYYFCPRSQERTQVILDSRD